MQQDPTAKTMVLLFYAEGNKMHFFLHLVYLVALVRVNVAIIIDYMYFEAPSVGVFVAISFLQKQM